VKYVEGKEFAEFKLFEPTMLRALVIIDHDVTDRKNVQRWAALSKSRAMNEKASCTNKGKLRICFIHFLYQEYGAVDLEKNSV
jgi:hypothetical protein